jgi:hypothetical protein
MEQASSCVSSARSRVDNTAVAEFYRLEPKLAGCVPTFVCKKGHTVTILAIFKTLFKCPKRPRRTGASRCSLHLFFVRGRALAQVFHHARAKRRSLPKLTTCTDVRLVRDNILDEETRRYMRLPGPTIELALRSWRRQERGLRRRDRWAS